MGREIIIKLELIIRILGQKYGKIIKLVDENVLRINTLLKYLKIYILSSSVPEGNCRGN